MGTPLVIGIVIYLLLIIALTTWFLRFHLQKSLTDLESQHAQATPLPSGNDTVNLENALELSESAARDETPSFRSTETDLFPKKK